MSSEFDRDFLVTLAINSYHKKIRFNEEEFKKDFFKFFIIRKMIKRFIDYGIIREKLILNNIIICLNVFGIDTTNYILRVICTDNEFSIVKSCLVFLNSFNLQNDNTEINQVITDILNDITYRYTVIQTGE
jgi:hypothetical protein